AVVRPTCQGFGRSFREGPLVSADDALASDTARNVPRRRFFPADVEAVPGHRVPLDRWMALEADLLGALGGADDQVSGPFALVARARDVLYDGTGAERVPVRPEQARAAEEALLRALRIVMGRVVEGPGGTEAQRAFAR